MLSAICFNLDQSKILSFGNGLKMSPYQIVLIQDQTARFVQSDLNLVCLKKDSNIEELSPLSALMSQNKYIYLSQTSPVLTCLQCKSFENTM